MQDDHNLIEIDGTRIDVTASDNVLSTEAKINSTLWNLITTHGRPQVQVRFYEDVS